MQSVVDDPLVLQLLEKLTDVDANLGWIGEAELRLQFLDDLAERALAIAALQYLQARTLQTNRAFGKQDRAAGFGAALLLGAPAAAGRQSRLAGIFWRCHASWPQCGTRPA